MRKKTLKQIGTYKEQIAKILFSNPDVIELLLGDTSKMNSAQIRREFQTRVMPHLFIDDTTAMQWSYIFYDMFFDSISSETKSGYLRIFCICHRDIILDYDSPLDKDGDVKYPGTRCDALAQMVEDSLCNEHTYEFGIGSLNLETVTPYFSSHFYGLMMDFRAVDFR